MLTSQPTAHYSSYNERPPSRVINVITCRTKSHPTGWYLFKRHKFSPGTKKRACEFRYLKFCKGPTHVTVNSRCQMTNIWLGGFKQMFFLFGEKPKIT